MPTGRATSYGEGVVRALEPDQCISDALGPTAGDQVLTGPARILRRTLRKPDTFGPPGGDEFAVLAPERDEVAARHMAERRCQAMEVKLPGADFPGTISSGMAACNEVDDSIASTGPSIAPRTKAVTG